MYLSGDACVCMSDRPFTHSDRDKPAPKCTLWIDFHAFARDIYTALDQDERWDNNNSSTSTLAISWLEIPACNITSVAFRS